MSGLLELDRVRVNAGPQVLLQLSRLSFAPGQVSAVLGPNGAGKSTLLSLLSGQRRPDRGEVNLDGQPLRSHRAEVLARRRALMAQDTQVAFGFLVREVVELGRYPHRLRPSRDEAGIVTAAMRATQVEALAQRELNTLSGGERARAHLARALAQIWDAPADDGARWLLLDEPTAALDLRHQHEVLALARDWARQAGVGVVAVLHDTNLALRYADVAVVLQGGAVAAQGAVADVIAPHTLDGVWQVGSATVCHPDGTPQLLVAGRPGGPPDSTVFQGGSLS